MSKAEEYVKHYITEEERGKLDKELLDEDIPFIAEEMHQWEEKLVGPLELTPTEVSDIHERYKEPILKRYA